MLSWLLCYLFLHKSPVSFVPLILSFVLFALILHLFYLPLFCSCPHPQYLTDLEEEVHKLYVRFLQKKVFKAWFNMVTMVKMDSQSKYETAVEHSHR